MNTKKRAKKVLILGSKLFINFFGEFKPWFSYTKDWIMQELFFKRYPKVFDMFSTVINRVMRISLYLWGTKTKIRKNNEKTQNNRAKPHDGG